MRGAFTAVCAVFLAASAYSADLTGHWLATMHLPDGRTRELSLYFEAKGDLLTGYLSNWQGNAAISEGRISGNTISFAIVRDYFGEKRTTEYKGTFSAGTLTLETLGPGGRPGRPLVFRQVSTETPPPMPPAPPKLSLPAAPPVPYNGLAKTPPMGWNSWNKFAGRVDDKIVREIADAMVETGMRDAGYIYVNIDDTWQGTRDAQGNIRPNEKFPDMKALADYVHSKGLKIGIYSGPGPQTCAHFAGSLGHEEQDAKMYAEWGIDYLKYDLCSFIPAVMQKQAPRDKAAQMKLMIAAYDKMSKALKATGRPIVLSLCQYGWDSPWEWAPELGGNLWRTTG